ncbi:MAG: DUF4271 domain-containing protein [Rikenellaceae bacterium]
MQHLLIDTIHVDSLKIDSLNVDSTVVDSVKTILGHHIPDINRVFDISQIFGNAAVKSECVNNVLPYVYRGELSWFSAIVLCALIIIYVILIKRYGKEIIPIAKVIFFPSLFDRMHDENNVHIKNYLTYGFIFSCMVVALLSWTYVSHGDVLIPICVYFYFVFKGIVMHMIALKQGRKSPISKSTYFFISCCTTSFCVLTPVTIFSLLFGVRYFLFVLIIIVLSSYYLFLLRFFCREKFSFKQILLYLCTAEVIPLVLVSGLFYSKIIAFGN